MTPPNTSTPDRHRRPRRSKPPISDLAGKGYALQRLRERAHLSLQDVAKDCGCTRAAVCKWELLHQEPQRQYRRDYAKCLGITVGKLGRLIYEAVDQALG